MTFAHAVLLPTIVDLGYGASQTPVEFETCARAVDRRQRVVTFPAGQGRFASTIVDITDRKRAEEQAQRQTAVVAYLKSKLFNGIVFFGYTNGGTAARVAVNAEGKVEEVKRCEAGLDSITGRSPETAPLVGRRGLQRRSWGW
jgi:hypothetical protein